jgi:hypothetical protein
MFKFFIKYVMQHTLFKESDSANLIEQANTPNKTLPCLPEKAPERSAGKIHAVVRCVFIA